MYVFYQWVGFICGHEAVYDLRFYVASNLTILIQASIYSHFICCPST